MAEGSRSKLTRRNGTGVQRIRQMAVWAIKGAVWIVILVVPHDRDICFVQSGWRRCGFDGGGQVLPQLSFPSLGRQITTTTTTTTTIIVNPLMQGQIKGTSRLQIQLEIESIQADIGSEGLSMNRRVNCLDRPT